MIVMFQKSKNKVIEFLDNNIKALNLIKNSSPYYSNFDLWNISTQRILKRLFGEEVLTEYLKCLEYEPSHLELGFSEMGYLTHELIARESIENEKKLEHKKFICRLNKISNLLEALKNEVQFFDDKKLIRLNKKIKKYFELKGRIPGLVEGKVGVEETRDNSV